MPGCVLLTHSRDTCTRNIPLPSHAGAGLDNLGLAVAYRVCIYSVAMSVKHGLLALLERGPMHGYQLRAAFEESTGGTWPLNIGQVYTTLSRLERDGLVHPLPANDAGQRPDEIT